MAIFEFISVLEDAIVASGGTVLGVAVDPSVEIRSFGAGQLSVDNADQASRALIFLASRLMFRACNNLEPATELRWPVPDHRKIDSNLRTFDLKVAAAILHFSPVTLRKLAESGVVPGLKIGRRWLFTDEALAEYLRGEIKKQTASRRGEEPGEKASDAGFYPRSGRRRPMEPPPLPVLPEDPPVKSGRRARIHPLLPKIKP